MYQEESLNKVKQSKSHFSISFKTSNLTVTLKPYYLKNAGLTLRSQPHLSSRISKSENFQGSC